MINRKVALSAGHSNQNGKDNGAVYHGRVEGKETVKLRSDLVKKLKDHGIIANADVDSNVTFETVKLFKEYFGEHDIVIDIHFNASSSPSATGVEVLIPTKYSTMEYAMAVDMASVISYALGIRNRGVKREDESARGKLLFMSINAETILIEICFISNKTDMARYDTNYNKLVDKIAEVILNYKTIQTL